MYFFQPTDIQVSWGSDQNWSLPEIGDRSLRWHSLCSKILTSAPTIGCAWTSFNNFHKKSMFQRIYPHDVEEVWKVLRTALQSQSDPLKEPGRGSLLSHLTRDGYSQKSQSLAPVKRGQFFWQKNGASREKMQNWQIQTWAHPPCLGRLTHHYWHCQAACCQWRQQHFLTSSIPNQRWKVGINFLSLQDASAESALSLFMIGSSRVVLFAQEFFSQGRVLLLLRDGTRGWLESLLLGDSLSGWESTGRLRAWELCSRADIRVRTGCCCYKSGKCKKEEEKKRKVQVAKVQKYKSGKVQMWKVQKLHNSIPKATAGTRIKNQGAVR